MIINFMEDKETRRLLALDKAAQQFGERARWTFGGIVTGRISVDEARRFIESDLQSQLALVEKIKGGDA